MKRIFSVLAVVALSLGTAVPAVAANLKMEFAKAWSARQADYTGQSGPARSRVMATQEVFFAIKDERDSSATAKANDLLNATSEYGRIQGRLTQLLGFNAFFATNPSQAAAEFWLQSRVSELQTLQRNAESEWQVARTPESAGVAGKAYTIRALKALLQNAFVKGATDETQLLDENLGTYFRAKSEGDLARRRARAAIFGAIGGALQQSAQQPIMPPSTTVRCDTYGPTTTCR